MTIGTTPHLVVQRELGNGTDLHEFWVLQSYNWHGHSEPPSNPPVQVHVAKWTGTGDLTEANLPRSDDCATASTSWSEIPNEVREAFKEEARRIEETVSIFNGEEE